MAGLNDIISSTAQQTTTLPSWFDSAQQNAVNYAGTALGSAPQLSQTVGQNAVNTLSGPTNPYTTAAGTLQSIATGAANPWITNSATGQVTPDTSTAMGGLFQAQNQQLNQLMPNITAPVEGANIGSGQFGSLRGQTAVDKAMGDAQAALAAQQMQASLQNQATGVNAASGAGNVTQQDINSLLTTGQYQQAAPFVNTSNYGKILGGIQSPTTVSNQTQLSPLSQIAGLMQALGGAAGTTGILGALGLGGTSGLFDSIKGLFSGSDITSPSPYLGTGDAYIPPDSTDTGNPSGDSGYSTGV
jgi:hypothetical protein